MSVLPSAVTERNNYIEIIHVKCFQDYCSYKKKTSGKNRREKYSPHTALHSACLTVCPLTVCLSEWGGQLSGVNHLLPSVSSDAIGQAAE